MRIISVFFFMAVFILFYTYIIGGENSMLMLYMFIISPIISVVLVYPAARRIDISVKAPTAEVEKDGTVDVSVVMRNKTILPVPFIDIEFIETENLSLSDMPSFRVSLGSLQTRVINIEYTAKRRGIAAVGVKDISVRDYLGFFRFSLMKQLEDSQVAGEITVLPRIFNMRSNSKIMMSSGQTDAFDDNGTSPVGINNWVGEPGYEFREYQAGDSLHKIHWKLSAKKDILMVRKDEGRGIPRKSLVVDPYIMIMQEKRAVGTGFLKRLLKGSDPVRVQEKTLLVEEKILEAVLSIVNLAVKTGREMDVWLLEDGYWVQYQVKDIKSIYALQYRLAVYKFSDSLNSNSYQRLPLSNIIESRAKSRNSGGGEFIVFTCCPDTKLAEAVNVLLNYRMEVDMVVVKNIPVGADTPVDIRAVFPALAQGKVWELKTDEDITEAFI